LALLTFLPMPEVGRLAARQGADLRAAKETLALEVTAIVHGRPVAEAQQKAARAAFGAVDGGGDVPAAHTAAGTKIVDLLATSGLAPSKSAARRLVEQGGVRIGDRAIKDVDET